MSLTSAPVLSQCILQGRRSADQVEMRSPTGCLPEGEWTWTTHPLFVGHRELFRDAILQEGPDEAVVHLGLALEDREKLQQAADALARVALGVADVALGQVPCLHQLGLGEHVLIRRPAHHGAAQHDAYFNVIVMHLLVQPVMQQHVLRGVYQHSDVAPNMVPMSDSSKDPLAWTASRWTSLDRVGLGVLDSMLSPTFSPAQASG